MILDRRPTILQPHRLKGFLYQVAPIPLPKVANLLENQEDSTFNIYSFRSEILQFQKPSTIHIIPDKSLITLLQAPPRIHPLNKPSLQSPILNPKPHLQTPHPLITAYLPSQPSQQHPPSTFHSHLPLSPPLSPSHVSVSTFHH